MNRTVLAIGILITAALVGVFFMVLGKDPQFIESPLVGRVAPPFALQAVGTHEIIDLTQYRGKPVVLNFWPTWPQPSCDRPPAPPQAPQLTGRRLPFVALAYQPPAP